MMHSASGISAVFVFSIQKCTPFAYSDGAKYSALTMDFYMT